LLRGVLAVCLIYLVVTSILWPDIDKPQMPEPAPTAEAQAQPTPAAEGKKSASILADAGKDAALHRLWRGVAEEISSRKSRSRLRPAAIWMRKGLPSTRSTEGFGCIIGSRRPRPVATRKPRAMTTRTDRASSADSGESETMNFVADPFDDDKLHEECGVFGVFGKESAAAMTALGLHALQHRGQEAAGIVSFNGEHFHSHHALAMSARISTRDRSSAGWSAARQSVTRATRPPAKPPCAMCNRCSPISISEALPSATTAT